MEGRGQTASPQEPAVKPRLGELERGAEEFWRALVGLMADELNSQRGDFGSRSTQGRGQYSTIGRVAEDFPQAGKIEIPLWHSRVGIVQMSATVGLPALKAALKQSRREQEKELQHARTSRQNFDRVITGKY